MMPTERYCQLDQTGSRRHVLIKIVMFVVSVCSEAFIHLEECCNATPAFPRDLDFPTKETPPEISTTTTMTTTTTVQLPRVDARICRRGFRSRSAREYRRSKGRRKKREKRDANSFSPLSLPTPGNSHRLRVTVFVVGRARKSKRTRERERDRG